MATVEQEPTRQEELQRMIAEAQSRPGVADAMEVYHAWEEYQLEAQTILAAMKPRDVSISSSASKPV